MNPIFILLGGDGYYGRNFQFYLSEMDISFIVIDIRECDTNFYSMFPIGNHLVRYIRFDLKNEMTDEWLKNEAIINEGAIDNSIIVNFAAISFVDYSIENPNRTIVNNVKCCENGLKLFKKGARKFIHISTDEVHAMKPEHELSPYIVSKKKCEELCMKVNSDEKYKGKIKIIRPVNLMDVINCKFHGLNQRNPCLLKKISELNKGGLIEIHGDGNQMRMFMTMRNACDLLFNVALATLGPEKDLFDVVETPNLRTCDIKIRDLVQYICKVFGFKYLFVKDPRGRFQDMTYCITKREIYSYYSSSRDCAKIVESLKRMRNSFFN